MLKNWRDVQIKSAWRLFVASLAGIPLGLWFLKGTHEGPMKICLALIIIFFSTYSLVKRVQSALAKKGYDPGPLDGQMGRRTGLAIKAFQNDQGLYPDGDASPALLRLLTAPDLPRAVQLVQDALSRIGYDVGSIDGRMGPGTKRAIREFQKDRLLKPDGLLTAELVGMATDTAAVFPSAGEQVVSDVSRPGETETMNRYEDRRWSNRAEQ